MLGLPRVSARKKKVPACRREPLFFSGNRETFIETFLRLFQFVFKCGCTVTALPVLIFRASTGSWKRTGRTVVNLCTNEMYKTMWNEIY